MTCHCVVKAAVVVLLGGGCCAVVTVVPEPLQDPEMNSSIKMEVGIEDCLHIEFEYNKSKCVAAAVGR